MIKEYKEIYFYVCECRKKANEDVLFLKIKYIKLSKVFIYFIWFSIYGIDEK